MSETFVFKQPFKVDGNILIKIQSVLLMHGWFVELHDIKPKTFDGLFNVSGLEECVGAEAEYYVKFKGDL